MHATYSSVEPEKFDLFRLNILHIRVTTSVGSMDISELLSSIKIVRSECLKAYLTDLSKIPTEDLQLLITKCTEIIQVLRKFIREPIKCSNPNYHEHISAFIQLVSSSQVDSMVVKFQIELSKR